MARPNIFRDEAKVQAVLNALKLGLSIKTAAKIVGCTYQTVHNECRRNKAFFARIKEAQGSCEQALVAMVYKAAQKGQWTAAAWMLERKWPDKWGKRERTPLTPKEPEHDDGDNPALA